MKIENDVIVIECNDLAFRRFPRDDLANYKKPRSTKSKFSEQLKKILIDNFDGTDGTIE